MRSQAGINVCFFSTYLQDRRKALTLPAPGENERLAESSDTDQFRQLVGGQRWPGAKDHLAQWRAGVGPDSLQSVSRIYPYMHTNIQRGTLEVNIAMDDVDFGLPPNGPKDIVDILAVAKALRLYHGINPEMSFTSGVIGNLR
jgi:hypothetical protein